MLIIFDDIIKELQNSGGISVYWDNLKNNLERDITSISYNGPSNLNDSKYNLLFKRYTNFKIEANFKHIFHSSYYRVSKNNNSKNVVTVHDFVYEYFSKGLRKFVHILQKRNAIQNAHRIICVSEHTKQDLLKFYPQIDKSIIKVIYHGVSNDFYNINSHNFTNKNKIIFVGKRSGYKNFKILIESFPSLIGYELILVGGGKLLKDEIESLNKINFVHHLNISNSKLNELYNNSFVLIYPSLYEGFGLPILEALKAGCPVICNDSSSTAEIGSNYVLKGVMTVDFIVKSVAKLENQSFRQEMILKGIKYASTFTWDKTAKETIRLYQELWEEFQ